MKYLILGKVYEAVKCGDETDWYENATDENTTCGDCGCKVGEQHFMGCDIERCPKCAMQMITCDCGPIYQVTKEDVKNKEYMAELIKKQQLEREINEKELADFLKTKEEIEQE